MAKVSFRYFYVFLYSLHIRGFKLIRNYADPVSSSGALLEAFDTIAKQLRLLDDVPLKISTVQPLDSGLMQFPFVFYYSLCMILLFTISLIVCDTSFRFRFFLCQLLGTLRCFLLNLIHWHMEGIFRGYRISQQVALDP